jgi:superfamily II DNA or RNA helicase
MQDLGSNSKTLVLTLKAVQKQWVEEIKNVIGANAQISENGLDPKKWTVLYYDNFSSGKNLQKIIETTKNAGYAVVIFDELHKLKHSTSKRSQNLEDATDNIPYKWGASATISANRAMDVRNQLVMVGHPLGKISESKFKRDFAGMVPGGYRGSYTEGTFEDRIRAAEKLNKWLNLSGVYVRRTKDELREMPNLSVGTSATPIDQDKFEKDLREKLKGYKDPDLAISELIASREILANLKVDHTVETAVDIVKKNLKKPENNYAASKVVIFTNFTNPGKNIYEKLSSKLKEIDPNFKVLTYLSMTKKSEREKVKDIFTNDPNTKALVMSMKMGGTGISFPNASQNMIINDFDWTPESAEQSEGRIYRINTNHPVNITYTLTDGLDTELFTVVQRKRKLAEMIQKYRKEYQEKEVDESLIQKIVDAQKKMQEIDEEIRALIAGAAAKAMKESYSFKDYLEFF